MGVNVSRIRLGAILVCALWLAACGGDRDSPAAAPEVAADLPLASQLLLVESGQAAGILTAEIGRASCRERV